MGEENSGGRDNTRRTGKANFTVQSHKSIIEISVNYSLNGSSPDGKGDKKIRISERKEGHRGKQTEKKI